MKKYIFTALLLADAVFASTLRLSYSANVGRLNPVLATDSASSEISDWLFDSLLKYDKNGQISPQMAKSYRFTDDKTLVIELKEGLKWWDGKPVTAKDAVFTYEFTKNPKVFTPYAENYRKVESVTAKDEKTIVVKYKEPYFKALEVWLGAILPSHILSNEKEPMTSKFNFNPVGNGTYRLTKLEQGKEIELTANPSYFEGEAKIKRVLYQFLPDSSTQFLMLKTGKLDIGSLTPMQLAKQIDSSFRQKYQIIQNQGSNYTYLGFNLKNPKFQNKKLREALSLAIDRQEIIDLLFFGKAKVSTGPFLPGSYGYDGDVKKPSRDIKEAKRLLRELGYDEKNPFRFEISTNSNNPLRMLSAEIIQQQLKDVGVDARIRAMEWQAFLNTVVDPRRFEAVLMGWSMPLSPDAYSIWHSSQIEKKAGFNFLAYKNDRVDALIEKGEKTIDRKALEGIYKEIFRVIADDKPCLFLYAPDSIVAVSKKIKNIEPSIIGIMHNRTKWEIEE